MFVFYYLAYFSYYIYLSIKMKIFLDRIEKSSTRSYSQVRDSQVRDERDVNLKVDIRDLEHARNRTPIVESDTTIVTI